MAISFTCISRLHFLCFLLVSHLARLSALEKHIKHSLFPPPLDCSQLQHGLFPFSSVASPACGLYTVECNNSRSPTIKFQEGGKSYVINNLVYEENMLVIQDEGLYLHSRSNFSNFLYNFTKPTSPYVQFLLETPSYAFFKCKGEHQTEINHPGLNHVPEGDHDIYFGLNDSQPPHQRNCSVTHFPLQWLPPDSNESSKQLLLDQLDAGFTLKWNLIKECSECYQEKGGSCSRNNSASHFDCSNAACSHGGKDHNNIRKIIVIGTSAAAGAVIFLVCVFLIACYREGIRTTVFFCTEQDKEDHDIERFLKNYGSLVPKRYHYSNLRKITNSFKDKLGQGGFGEVFKGKLDDGRLVAVKVLSNSKCNGGEFMNEVASIGRTNHMNIVGLLGFCSERSKRALIYEFMPNGSLEQFIYDKRRKTNFLGWNKLYEIAVGISRGLEYLHSGCNTRIVHLDIKPHNILLGADFQPKISDFGLAKICPPKESIISMTGARGTAGYIAPEVFCRNFGGVSHKSDVYSYGMMVLEMVGGRRNIEATAEKTSDICFLHWICKRVELNEHLDLHGITTREEEDIAKKMIMVALWCIQVDPADRPTISRVVEMLEGSIESVPVPPTPFLSSPSRTSQLDSSASTS